MLRGPSLVTFAGNERYQVVRRLGEGTMGMVYEALDRQSGTRVALKQLRRAHPGWLYRFKQEFRLLADVTHPNLATLYELFAEDDQWFFTMELVEGVDFLRYVRTGPVAPDDERVFAATLPPSDVGEETVVGAPARLFGQSEAEPLCDAE